MKNYVKNYGKTIEKIVRAYIKIGVNDPNKIIEKIDEVNGYIKEENIHFFYDYTLPAFSQEIDVYQLINLLESINNQVRILESTNNPPDKIDWEGKEIFPDYIYNLPLEYEKKIYAFVLPSFVKEGIYNKQIVDFLNKFDKEVEDKTKGYLKKGSLYGCLGKAFEKEFLKNNKNFNEVVTTKNVLNRIETSSEDVCGKAEDFIKDKYAYKSFHEAKKSLYFFNKDFFAIYDYLDSYQFPDYERYSVALATYRFKEENPSYSLEDAIKYIITKREEFKSKVILGPNKNFIIFTNKNNKEQHEDILKFARDDAGVINFGPLDLNGGNKEKEILNSIKNSKGETVFWFNGHGNSEDLFLDSKKTISVNDMGQSLIERGNLKEIIIILESCFSYNYEENLIKNLQKQGATELPTIITVANKDSFGYSNSFLSSLQYVKAGNTGPLLGKQIYDAEKYTIHLQDSAVFFSLGESTLEIASNYIQEDCCGGMCSTKTTASLSKPTLMGRIKEKIVDFFS